MIVSLYDFDKVLEKLRRPGKYAADTETTGLRVWLDHRLFSLIIAAEDEAYYFNFNGEPDHLGNRAPAEYVLPRERLRDFNSVFQNPESLFFLHNAKFDGAAMSHEGIEFPRNVHCTEAGGRIERNDRFNYKLKTLVQPLGLTKSDAVDEYISKHKLYKKELNVKGEPEKQPQFHLVPFEIITEYGLNDAIITRKLGLHQEEEIRKMSAAVPGGKRTPWDVLMNERRLTRTCFAMEKAGVRIDRSYSAQAAEYEQGRVEEARREFKRLTGLEFVDSAKALAPAFDALGCKYPLTDKGNPSFTADVLEEFDNPVARLVKQYRSASKRRNTYYMNFLKFADQYNRIHANVRQAGTQPGRMSYSDPNFQNLPKRKESLETGPFKIRGAIIPTAGNALVMLDYDQMEYRLMLEYALEMGVIEQVLQGMDIHQATAQMMGVDRDAAKTLNFMLLYGGGVAKLCVALFKPTLELAVLKELVNTHLWHRPKQPALIADVPRGTMEENLVELVKAKELQDLYFERLPKVKEFTRTVQAVAKKRGHIRNWAGRICYFPNPSHAYAAPNHLIQGGCADVVKQAMNQLDDFMRGRKSKMLVQVHDELVFDMHPSEFGLVPEIKQIMESVYPYKHLPLTCGVDHSWKSWQDKSEGAPGGEETRDAV